MSERSEAVAETAETAANDGWTSEPEKLAAARNLVAELAYCDMSTFKTWFDEFFADEWDRQIERDAKSGRLDRAFQRLQQEHGDSPGRPLQELIDAAQATR